MSLKEVEEKLLAETQKKQREAQESAENQARFEARIKAENRAKLESLVNEILERPAGWKVVGIQTTDGRHELSLPGLDHNISLLPRSHQHEAQFSDDTRPVEVRDEGVDFARVFPYCGHNNIFFRWDQELNIVQLLRKIEAVAAARLEVLSRDTVSTNPKETP